MKTRKQIAEIMAQQRELIASFDTPAGYNHKAFLDEMTRRNGRPLEPSHQKYWAQQVAQYMRSKS